MNPQILSRAVAVGFALIGLASIWDWVRYRDQTRKYMAWALGLLGGIALLGLARNPAVQGPPALLLSLATTMGFMGSGYALVRLRGTLLPLSSRVNAVLTGGAAVSTVLMAATIFSSGSSPPVRTLQVASPLLYAFAWSACVGEPAVRFWQVSGTRPAVQRARLRALSLGYAGIVIALLLSVSSSFFPSTNHAAQSDLSTVLQLVALAVIPLLYASFAPPAWLRQAWRRHEGKAFREANRELMMFSGDARALAARALPWALRLVGADGGLIAGGDNEILALAALGEADARELLAGSQAEVTSHGHRHGPRAVLRFNLPLGNGAGALITVAGPLTPLFGADEIGALEEYASSLAVAIDRVRVMETLEENTRDLRVETRRNESLLDAISDMGEGVLVTENRLFVFANNAYLTMVGYTADELASMLTLAPLVPPHLRAELIERTQLRAAGQTVPSHYESQVVRKDGTIVDVEMGITTIPGTSPPQTMAIVRGIAERKESERQMALLSRTDSLTGVGNRHAWDDSLVNAIARARRDEEPLALAMVDLDRFKAFNDDWGHQRGDALLAEMGRSWKRSLREIDVLVRYGGDEFAILLPGCSMEAAREVLERIRLDVPERQTISIGLAVWDGREGSNGLVARADSALYAAKREGGDRVLSASPRDAAHDAKSWTAQLAAVVRDGGFESVYQPIVSLSTGSVLGYEALARPSGASADLSVEELFAAAQRLGYARDLDWLGRRAAVHGAHGLDDRYLLFVNVGLWSLLDPLHDVDQMLLLLQWAGRTPSTVVLEMSEREVVSDVGRLREVLASYRSEGFRFALDDVGEGHSTFEVLAAADAEFIKVGRSLTLLAAQPGAGSAIRALAAFATSTGAQVIAEGIEDEPMAEQMTALGVMLGQGFGLGRPARMASSPDPEDRVAAGG